MLNQIEQDPSTPYLMDPANMPAWANLFVTAFDRLWSQLAGRVNNLIPNDGTEGKAWTAFTPVITAGSGTFTSVTASGAYYKVGRMVTYRIHVAITTNGTAASYVLATVPFAAVSPGFSMGAGSGRADSVSGKGLIAIIGSGGNGIVIVNYDGSYPGANGETLDIAGHYEAQV